MLSLRVEIIKWSRQVEECNLGIAFQSAGYLVPVVGQRRWCFPCGVQCYNTVSLSKVGQEKEKKHTAL